MTTTSTGALKEGIRAIEHDLGVYALGGKGATSRKTPTEILDRCERLAVDPRPLLYASRMAAKVDSAALQDGYQLYHHSFFFSGSGQWCVVQQGTAASLKKVLGCATGQKWQAQAKERFDATGRHKHWSKGAAGAAAAALKAAGDD